jgi:hypothetical protein
VRSDAEIKNSSRQRLHESSAVIAERTDTEEQRAIERGTCGNIRIGVEIILDAVAEKNFVSEDILQAIENRLARHKTLSGQRERAPGAGSTFFVFIFIFNFGGSGFHSFSIGARQRNFNPSCASSGLSALACRSWPTLVMPRMWKTNGTPPLRWQRFHE